MPVFDVIKLYSSLTAGDDKLECLLLQAFAIFLAKASLGYAHGPYAQTTD